MLNQFQANASNIYAALLSASKPAQFGEVSLEVYLDVQKQADDARLQKKEIKKAKKELKKASKSVFHPIVRNILRGGAVSTKETPVTEETGAYRLEKDGTKTPVDAGFLRGFLGDAPQSSGPNSSRELIVEVIDHPAESTTTEIGRSAISEIGGNSEVTTVDEASLREPQTSLRDELVKATSEVPNTAMAQALLNPSDGKKNQKHNRQHHDKRNGNGNQG